MITEIKKTQWLTTHYIRELKTNHLFGSSRKEISSSPKQQTKMT